MKIKICLNAGHSGKTNRSPAVSDYFESEMAWKLHKLVGEALSKYNVEVVYTRSNINENLGNQARGQKARGCVAYYSFHSNATGTSKPNNDVDYPLCIVTTDSSNIKTLAGNIGKTIKEMMHTKQNNKVWTKLTNDGREWYGELRGCSDAGVPGIIIEHSFHTCEQSALWLMDESNLRAIAEAEAELIATYHGATLLTDCNTFTVEVNKAVYGDTSKLVRAAQRVLMYLGYDLGAGKDDGIFGDMTRAAIIAFQKNNRCTVSGEIDCETFSKLFGV